MQALGRTDKDFCHLATALLSLPLDLPQAEDYLIGVAGSALSVTGSIPVALSNSTGAGSVRILVRLPGAHLYIQVPGNQNRTSVWWSCHAFSQKAEKNPRLIRESAGFSILSISGVWLADLTSHFAAPIYQRSTNGTAAACETGLV